MRTQILAKNGTEIVIVIDLNAQTVDCGMCGIEGFHDYCVPWYCGPVRDGESEGGYRTVCKSCHDKWAEWDNQKIHEDSQARL